MGPVCLPVSEPSHRVRDGKTTKHQPLLSLRNTVRNSIGPGEDSSPCIPKHYSRETQNTTETSIPVNTYVVSLPKRGVFWRQTHTVQLLGWFWACIRNLQQIWSPEMSSWVAQFHIQDSCLKIKQGEATLHYRWKYESTGSIYLNFFKPQSCKVLWSLR